MARTSKPLQKPTFHTDWMDVPVLLDPGGVAIVLGLQHEAVRKALADGRLPGFKVLGNNWRVRKDELMAHLGYKDWEIERYGFGMATPAQGRGYNPMIRDDFSTALKRKDEDDYPSTAVGRSPSPDKGRQEEAPAGLWDGTRRGGVVDLNEMEAVAG